MPEPSVRRVVNNGLVIFLISALVLLAILAAQFAYTYGEEFQSKQLPPGMVVSALLCSAFSTLAVALPVSAFIAGLYYGRNAPAVNPDPTLLRKFLLTVSLIAFLAGTMTSWLSPRVNRKAISTLYDIRNYHSPFPLSSQSDTFFNQVDMCMPYIALLKKSAGSDPATKKTQTISILETLGSFASVKSIVDTSHALRKLGITSASLDQTKMAATSQYNTHDMAAYTQFLVNELEIYRYNHSKTLSEIYSRTFLPLLLFSCLVLAFSIGLSTVSINKAVVYIIFPVVFTPAHTVAHALIRKCVTLQDLSSLSAELSLPAAYLALSMIILLSSHRCRALLHAPSRESGTPEVG